MCCLQAGPVLKVHSPLAVTDIINAIQAYNDSMGHPRWLVQSTAEAHQEKTSNDFADEVRMRAFLSFYKLIHSFVVA